MCMVFIALSPTMFLCAKSQDSSIKVNLGSFFMSQNVITKTLNHFRNGLKILERILIAPVSTQLLCKNVSLLELNSILIVTISDRFKNEKLKID